MRRFGLPLALAGAYAALAVAWAVSSAPFTAPDEKAHYLRALGVADGELVGDRAAYDDPTQTPEARAWVRQLATSVRVPEGLSPVGWDCPVLRPVSAACQPDAPRGAGGREVTATGTYQPAPYLLPAAVVRLGDDAGEADRLGRIAGVLAWALLVGGAAVALWSPRSGRLALLGLVVAVTPMAVFVGASLTGSGLEIAAAIAFMAALLRLTRGERPAGWVWGLAGVAGVALALSRAPGPLWVLAAVIGAGALPPGGGGGVRRVASARPVAAAAVAAAVVFAVAVNRVWEAAHGPDATVGLSPLRESLATGWRQLDGVLLQSVGEFGHLQVALPAPAYAVWGLMAVALLALALGSTGRRGRVVLAAAIAGAGAFPILFFAAVARHAGIPLQGRHVLALFAIVALLAGESVYRNRDRIPEAVGRRLLPAFLAAAAAIHVVAWWVNARRWPGAASKRRSRRSPRPPRRITSWAASE